MGIKCVSYLTAGPVIVSQTLYVHSYLHLPSFQHLTLQDHKPRFLFGNYSFIEHTSPLHTYV